MDAREDNLAVGTGAEARDIAILRREGKTPGLFWLGGFKSDMIGSKAQALDALGEEKGFAVTRFDYSGHGASGGAFLEGTISRWLEESLAVFSSTEGEQIVVGSSMGGWLALLLNRALRARGEKRVRGIVLIAPAVDMTQDLMRSTFTDAELLDLWEKGRVEQPSDYSDEPYVLTRELIEDGEKHLMFGQPIRTHCPVAILQGGKDTDVPPAHALKLVSHLISDPVTFTLIPDGDHRLSRETDIEKLLQTVLRLV
ncbi:alpha/beta hydrolase [Pelagibacterium xiamenense]|uniref:alpha/beta hydrolase n=1 Tax=Pelagibacterium xiamenense TaxID=2901140 RepID=UPI001E3BDCD3|nr:alpha/beta hydrolase [Pelagibacterium xiamenense]MCD7058731.1 alpha/beta hydrolase [Pelagibacterium xiamenense]